MKICVFCGSSTRVAGGFLDLARDLGDLVARRGHTLVWGGGSVGLMGAVAGAAQAAGGKVVGVIPSFLSGTEVEYRRADELVVTEDMRRRKTILEERSDGFIVLPGGVGTLEELFEILALRLLRRHDKPVAVVNHEGFYDGLLRFLEELHEKSFLSERFREYYSVFPDPASALEAVEKACAERGGGGDPGPSFKPARRETR